MKKYSYQRENILNALKADKTHPTAEELFFEVKKSIPNVSLATVYRNLRLLKSENNIISFDCGDGKEHFDADILPHAHLKCESCGAVTDIFLTGEELALIENIGGGNFQLIFSGACKHCKIN